MVRRANPNFRRLGLVSALVAALPGTIVAQERPTAVLPPPSLYDTTPPAATGAGQSVTAPRPASTAPVTAPATSVAPRPASTAPVTAPATSAAPRAAEPVVPSTPSSSAAPASAGATRTYAEASAPTTQDAPWYKRMWGTVTGWFGRNPTATLQQDPTMVAVAPSTSSTPVTLASPRASTTVAPTAGYAQDTPERTIRTGMFGECVRTGMWEPSDVMAGCGAGQTTAKVEERMAAPAPVAVEPRVEAVEVQPLAAPTLKEEKSLDVEPPMAAQPEPVLEPEPVAMPEPAPPQPEMTTLAADALFALGSYQLKPSARASLDEFAAKLKSMEFENVKITGHTDPTGKAAFNDRLSRQRADSVKRYLVSRGVPAERIQTEGVGSSMPMVIETDCATLPRVQKVACYQPDRRVEIEVQGATSRVAAQ